jgi:hypothetical protein
MFDHKLKPAVTATLFGFLFVAISLGLMISNRGIPAVFDGNETFSSILHARNLLTFGPKVAAGLADESTSPHVAGHAVVHTHQGNFPRLYAMVLSATGLDGPVSQVAATVLPIGFAGVLFLFWSLYRYAGLGLAIAAASILLTDYILFVQWQVVTYRLWHFAFAAALLATAISYRETPRRWLLAAAFVISLFLFYYELVFATFLSVSVSAFVIFLWRRDVITGLIFVGAQLAGAIATVCILIGQLIGYLGWDGFVSDLRLTYLSRNTGISDPARLAELRAFVEQNNIAFFYNFVDGNEFRSVGFIRDAIFRWGLQVYTPPFTYCILVLAFGLAVALFGRTGAIRHPKYAIAGIAAMAALGWMFGAISIVFWLITLGIIVTNFVLPDSRKAPELIGFVEAGLVLGPLAIVFLLMAVTFSQFLGFESAFSSDWSYWFSFGIALCALAGFLVMRSMFETRGNLSLDAVVRAAAVLCVAIAFSRFHHRLYDQSLAALWEHSLPGSFMPIFLQRVGMIAATGCAMAVAAFGPLLPYNARSPLRNIAKKVAALIGCFLIGLLVAVILFPGYVYSGYMVRYLNFLVLPFALAIGFVFYAMVIFGKNLAASMATDPRPSLSLSARLACVALPLFFVAWWAAIQSANANLFRANGLDVLNALQSIKPGRPTIVSNTYTGPFSVVTGQWSYLDETFASGRTTFSPASGYGYAFDRKHVWFADRKTNPEYERPDAFVCLSTPNYHSAAFALARRAGAISCANNTVVQLARRHDGKIWPRHVIAARDESGRDVWAIVKLDWDFPPYLRSEPKITGAITGSSAALTVRYDFQQQDGKPESQTDVEIWPIVQTNTLCAVEGAPLGAQKATGGRATFNLGLSTADQDFIVTVRPQTATRIGASFFSSPFRLGGGAAVTGRTCGILRDAGGHHWSRIEGD